MKLSIDPDKDDGDCLYVRVAGNINQEQRSHFFSEPLRQLFGTEIYSREVLLNLQDADTIDSSGVSWLLDCTKQFRESGGQFVLHSLPPAISSVIQLLRMDRVFLLAKNEEEARRIARESTK